MRGTLIAANGGARPEFGQIYAYELVDGVPHALVSDAGFNPRSNGTFELNDLPAAPLVLVAGAVDAVSAVAEVDTSAGNATVELEFGLGRSVQLLGRCSEVACDTAPRGTQRVLQPAVSVVDAAGFPVIDWRHAGAPMSVHGAPWVTLPPGSYTVTLFVAAHDSEPVGFTVPEPGGDNSPPPTLNDPPTVPEPARPIRSAADRRRGRLLMARGTAAIRTTTRSTIERWRSLAAALLLASCTARDMPLAREHGSTTSMPTPSRAATEGAAPVAATATPRRPPPPVGTVTLVDGLRVLRMRGSPRELGFQHGHAFAAEIKEGFTAFVLGYRCHGVRARYAQIAKRVEREIEFPPELLEELDGIIEGMRASGADLVLPLLRRPIERADLLALNTLDHWGLFGCSGFTAWGGATDNGEVLVARNFDFDVDQPGGAIARLNVVLAFEPDGGVPFVSLAFPGLVGIATGFSARGVGAFLHVGNGAFGGGEIGLTRPLMAITRQLLEYGDSADAALRARELLTDARIRNSFLLRVTTNGIGAPPTTVFEIDPLGVVEQTLPDAARGEQELLLTTNHFTSGKMTFPAIPDSKIRWCALEDEAREALAGGDHRIGPAEAQKALTRVAQHVGNVTLHALVWRPKTGEIWLDVSDQVDGRIAAATSGTWRTLHLSELLATD